MQLFGTALLKEMSTVPIIGDHETSRCEAYNSHMASLQLCVKKRNFASIR